MATKPRHEKTPTQLWVADNRKRLGLTPRDLAEMTGVTEDTARGWESRGKPSQDAIDILTRRFGVKPPDDRASPAGSDTLSAGLVAQLQAQTEAINALVEELRAARIDRDEFDELRETVHRLAEEALGGAGSGAPTKRGAPGR